jgi:hypothetical protein
MGEWIAGGLWVGAVVLFAVCVGFGGEVLRLVARKRLVE